MFSNSISTFYYCEKRSSKFLVSSRYNAHCSLIIRILAALKLEYMKMSFVPFLKVIHWLKLPEYNGFVVVCSVGIVSVVIGDEENEAPPIN